MQTFGSYWLAAAALLAPLPTLADLPVHCLRHQVAGDWQFTVGPDGPKRSSCGHMRPDSPDNQPSMDFVSSLGATSQFHVSLQDPATAQAEDGSTGTWTMIYDEGFEVALGDMVYFAFSDFEYKQDPNTDRKTNISHCGATQVGWYHNKARTRWGCYLGRKIGDTSDATASGDDNSASSQPAAHASLSSLSTEHSILMPDEDDSAEQPAEVALAPFPSQQTDSASTNFAIAPSDYQPWVPGSPGYDKPMPHQWQESVAGALNLLQLGWRAATYSLFKGKTPRELNKYAGVRRGRLHVHTQTSENSSSFSSFLGLRSSVKRHLGAASFDWRNHKGKDWLEPVVTQGDCGSCYTISTVHMLTARNRIQHGNPSESPFSVSFPLYCSEYNQGCDGGYGFLQTKWSEDVGLIPATCAPFSQGGGSCQSVVSNCDLGSKRYRASNHHYVGGYYGGSDEHSIRKELVSNGPVVMSFEPKEDFMYYKSGIYKSGPNKLHQEWEQVDHAVLLVGLGSEGGQPYWTMQNSWGTDWGENGFFRMARGVDESGCESIVVAAEVAEDSSNEVLDNFLSSL